MQSGVDRCRAVRLSTRHCESGQPSRFVAEFERLPLTVRRLLTLTHRAPDDRLDAALDEVGCPGRLGAQVATLSGGELRRAVWDPLCTGRCVAVAGWSLDHSSRCTWLTRGQAAGALRGGEAEAAGQSAWAPAQSASAGSR